MENANLNKQKTKNTKKHNILLPTQHYIAYTNHCNLDSRALCLKTKGATKGVHVSGGSQNRRKFSKKQEKKRPGVEVEIWCLFLEFLYL